jgi:hypothetical protein
MAKPKKTPAAAQAPIDPRSETIVLEYVDGRTARYVPARDLSGNDLARIAYRRATDKARASRRVLVAPGAQRVKPSRPALATPRELKVLAAELVSSGRFARNQAAPADDNPPAPESGAPPEPSNDPPAPPAPDPEGEP